MSEALFRERSRVCPECEGNGGQFVRYQCEVQYARGRTLANVICLMVPSSDRYLMGQEIWEPCNPCRGAGYVVVEDH